MKLPFDFGIKLFFRLVIPGFFVALGFLPVMNSVLRWGGWTQITELTFIIVVMLAGWLIVISDMWIYMLFEGRRFWPGRLWKFFLKREETRLKSIKDRIKCFEETERPTHKADKKNLEDYVELRKFPLSKKGEYQVEFPSRLGNLLAAYENYPERVYGMSGVFYWYRIWLKMDKDLKEEIDSKQAVADSTIYTSFGLYVVSLLWLFYAILSVIHKLFPEAKLMFIGQFPPIEVTGIISIVSFLSAYLIYRLSIPIHAQFGETFKSIFDTHQGTIDISAVIKEVADITGKPGFLTLNRKDQLKVAWRYLQYYRVRCPDSECNKLMSPFELKVHECDQWVETNNLVIKAPSVR